MKTIYLLASLAVACVAADYRTPAGLEKTRRTEEGSGTVLPGGRFLTPFGKEYTTGPGPFGLAISPSGDRIVTADGGPERFSLTILEKAGGEWRTRQLTVPTRVKPSERWPTRKIDLPSEVMGADSDSDWKSTFMGLAFDGEETLFASEGESGQVRVLDADSGKALRQYSLNSDGFADSYSGDLVIDSERGILYVVDQANFRVAVFDIRHHRDIASVRVGRLPFAIAFSPDKRRLYVTNIGMFAYKVLPGADAQRAGQTGLSFPPFGFPTKESLDGTLAKNAAGNPVVIPGVGDPNGPESNSVCAIDVENPAQPKVIKFIRTGVPFGPNSLGGSSPSGVVAAGRRVFVSNGTNDSVTIINADKLAAEKDIEIRVPGLERLRGVLPIGLGLVAERNQLLVAEAGINAVGVIDLSSDKFLGHIPAGWFPTRVAARGETIYVSNAKGHGIGPNATLEVPVRGSFLLEMRKGSLSRYTMPDSSRIPALTRSVIQNDGFVPVADAAAVPGEIKHVVIIVKENRTFDEVMGDVAGAPKLARYGRPVTPNQHTLAERWATSDNFYADSEMSVDGHHWLVGSYPNGWVESSFMATEKHFRLTPKSPGRLQVAEGSASVTPEDQLEAGTLWNHLDRHHVTFRNFGEGFEFPGVAEGAGLAPTGARFLTNIPMPGPLFANTSREYPGFNTNIPDQFRATQFIHEIDTLYETPKRPLPQLIFMHLPNDHTADPRPEDGYATDKSYIADNDYALGRIVEYLSHTPEWRSMAIFVTEDDAVGGVDHVDAHRVLLFVSGPWAKRGFVTHTNTSFPGLLKTVYRILGLGPLNLFDAASPDLSDCFTSEPDFKPYSVVPIDHAIFDPAKAREPLNPKPAVKMDDPREMKKEHERLEKP